MNDVIVSSRIRIARNVSEIPFTRKLNKQNSQNIITKVCSLLDGYKLSRINIGDISSVDKLWLIEKHLISTLLASNNNGAVLLSKDNSLSVMINEEDHIRIQALSYGLNLTALYERINIMDNILISNMPIAYDDKLGFLTACVTNVGTGLRASVMLFLPCLTLTGNIDKVVHELASHKVTVRGTFGEGTGTSSYMYQLSNQVTLNYSENQIINNVTNAVNSVVKAEMQAREVLMNKHYLQLVDQIMRSYGILTNAYKLSIDEFEKCFADVRLGVILKILNPIDNIDNMYTLAQEAHIAKSAGVSFDNTQAKEIYRAGFVKRYIIK